MDSNIGAFEISNEDGDVIDEAKVNMGDKREYERMKKANQDLRRQIESLKQERARNRQQIQYIINNVRPYVARRTPSRDKS